MWRNDQRGQSARPPEALHQRSCSETCSQTAAGVWVGCSQRCTTAPQSPTLTYVGCCLADTAADFGALCQPSDSSCKQLQVPATMSFLILCRPCLYQLPVLYILYPSSAPVPPCGLVNHCNVVCSCLIMLHPAPVDEVQSAICYQLPDSCLDCRGLAVPPGTEERLQAGTRCKFTCYRLWSASGGHAVSCWAACLARSAAKAISGQHKCGLIQKLWSLLQHAGALCLHSFWSLVLTISA